MREREREREKWFVRNYEHLKTVLTCYNPSKIIFLDEIMTTI